MRVMVPGLSWVLGSVSLSKSTKMKIKLPLLFGLGFAWAISGFVSRTPPAQAQSGTQSDITGVIVTTSDAAGSFRTGDRKVILAFKSSEIRNAVNTAASSINQQLAARSLPVVATGAPTAIPATVQQNIECVSTSIGDVGACSRQIESNLVNAGTDPTIARNLVSSLQGLTTAGKVDAGRFAAVVRAYNALINASSAEYLSNPPEELRALQSMLSILLNAAYSRR